MCVYVRVAAVPFEFAGTVHGLGGCLLAQEIGAVTADRFSLFESMSMLMLLVVAGAGCVSGGLTAGLLYGAVFVTMQSLLDKLGADYSAFHGPLAWLARFTTVLPALIGVGLGRNPSGFLNQVFAGWEPTIRRARSMFLAGIAAELALWFLALGHVISNWAFAVLTVVLLVALPRIAVLLRPAAFVPTGGDPGAAVPAWPAVPLERVGLDRAFTDEDRAGIDASLGLDQVRR